MDDKIKINLRMAGISFPLTVDRKDEQRMREAARRVDKRLGDYRNRYAQAVSNERILAMTAFQFALEGLEMEERNDTQPYADKVRELTQLLDDCAKG